MVKIAAYIKIIRLKNAAMTAVAVALGFWVSRSPYPLHGLALCMLAAICAVGFGNIVNDIHDEESDKTNHPDRPLPKGEISRRAAWIWALILAACALACGFSVSTAHGIGCLVPLALLALYAFALKGTPLAGNIIVSLMVAYAILYGALGAPQLFHLFMPAFLAFLLNLCREIVKDLQDKAGDALHGVITTASLPAAILTGMLFWFGIVYVLNMFVPFLMGHFGIAYLAICIFVLIPLHASWFIKLFKKPDSKAYAKISSLIKLEMLGGLAALAVDRLIAFQDSFSL